MNTKVKGDKIKEGSIPLVALADDVKGNFYGKYGLNNYLGQLTDTNPLFIEGPRTFIYMLANNKIYRFGQSVYKVTLSGNGPSITITGSQTSKGWTFTASGNTVALYEVKFYANKVDVETPTPDWNAQQGEAGFIENKPFGKFKVNGERFVVSTDPFICNVHYCIPQEPDIIDLYPSKKVDYIRVYWSVPEGDIVFIDEIINIPDGVTSMKTIKFVNDTPLGSFSLRFDKTESEIRVYLMSEDETFSVMANDALNAISVEAITHFPDEYLPDNVLKTTPQTLSDTGKNQALANLGIDPVVWKYTLNNIIIQENDILGSEYKDILLVSNGEPVCIKFPYNNLIKVVTDKGTFNAIPDTTYSNLYPLYFTTPDGTYNILSNEGQIYFEIRA